MVEHRGFSIPGTLPLEYKSPTHCPIIYSGAYIQKGQAEEKSMLPQCMYIDSLSHSMPSSSDRDWQCWSGHAEAGLQRTHSAR